MALACEGRNGEKCAGASRTGVVSLASSREKMRDGVEISRKGKDPRLKA